MDYDREDVFATHAEMQLDRSNEFVRNKDREDVFPGHSDMQLDRSNEFGRSKDKESALTYVILNLISERINTEVTADMKYSELQIDSLIFMEMILDLEKEFGIVIHNDALEKFKTVQDTITYAAKFLSANEPNKFFSSNASN